jgi:WXG100 family type VII secretion target
VRARVLLIVSAGGRGLRREEEPVSAPTGGNALSTDFDLMRSVAGAIDTRNEEIRAALQAFIGRMSGVPQSVWGGTAASRFKDVVHRWNAESMKLHQALHSIAETIRYNQVALQDAADSHAAHIGAAAGNL